MKLYHGSNMSIGEIDLKRGRRGKDFGQGFYLSADRSQAQMMAERSMTMEQAMDAVYGSHTYEKVERPSTGLFYQGAVYIMDMLHEELTTQKDFRAIIPPKG